MSLTEKELRVLELLKQGKTQKEIAETLGVSAPAITHFKQSALRKIEQARATAKRASELGFAILVAAIFLTLSSSVAATIPNPGHSAYSVGPGTNGSFFPGNYTFPNNLNVTNDLFLNNYLRIQSWPGYGTGESPIWYDGAGGLGLSVDALRVESNVRFSGTLQATMINATEDLTLNQFFRITSWPTYGTGEFRIWYDGNGSNGSTTGSAFIKVGDTTTPERFVFTEDGRFGINTTNATAALDVRGSANISGSVITPQFCLNGDCRTTWPAGTLSGPLVSNYVPYASSSSVLTQSPLFYNATQGFFGFGTTGTGGSLSNRLVVNGSIDFAGYDWRVGVANDPNWGLRMSVSPSAIDIIGGFNGSSGMFRIIDKNSGIENVYLQMDRYGNFGINKTNPSTTLDVNGVVTVSGSLSVPQINTNIYFSGANTGIGDATPSDFFVVGNGDLLRITSAGILRLPPAAPTTPALAFVADTDTGLFRPATNELAFVTGGTQRVTVNATGLGVTSGDLKTNGFVGAGTLTPAFPLDVIGNVRVQSGGFTYLFINTTQNTTRIGWYDQTVNLLVNGTINATGAITGNSGFDLAEAFTAEEPMAAGDLVIATGEHSVRKATRADAELVIGAVSTSPGFILGGGGLPNATLIGLAGRIPVKVQGSVVRGDFITVSDTSGIGEAAREPGFVIGRAIGDVENGTVMIIIQPTYFSPQVDAQNRLVGSTKEEVFATGIAIEAVAREPVAQVRGDDVVVPLATDDIVVTLG